MKFAGEPLDNNELDAILAELTGQPTAAEEEEPAS